MTGDDRFVWEEWSKMIADKVRDSIPKKYLKEMEESMPKKTTPTATKPASKRASTGSPLIDGIVRGYTTQSSLLLKTGFKLSVAMDHAHLAYRIIGQAGRVESCMMLDTLAADSAHAPVMVLQIIADMERAICENLTKEIQDCLYDAAKSLRDGNTQSSALHIAEAIAHCRGAR